MLVIKLILEGLGLGCLLCLICAVGIHGGAIGMIHLYDKKVQERVISLGMTTEEAMAAFIERLREMDGVCDETVHRTVSLHAKASEETGAAGSHADAGGGSGEG